MFTVHTVLLHRFFHKMIIFFVSMIKALEKMGDIWVLHFTLRISS